MASFCSSGSRRPTTIVVRTLLPAVAYKIPQFVSDPIVGSRIPYMVSSFVGIKLRQVQSRAASSAEI